MRTILVLALTLGFGHAAVSQQQDSADLLRRSSQHEKEAMQNQRPFQFQERKEYQWGSETRAVIETLEGRVDRIVAFNDQPLSPDQETKQQNRLARLLSNPSALRAEVAKQRDEDQRRELLVATFPDAIVLTFEASEPDGRLRFSFAPDPKFSPKNRETQVFKGMRGLLWIDPQSERIAEIRGELFKDVNFGWGILGRLYKGGHFAVVQTQVVTGVWRITTLELDFKGREFLFSAIEAKLVLQH